MSNAELPLDESGMWREVRCLPAAAAPRPALFLDRDGTLIELVDYLSKAEDVRPIAQAIALTAQATANNMPVIMVTNQSGIGRGYYGWHEFAAVQTAVLAVVAAGGGQIDAVYACPAMPESGAACRKPNPGMLLAAADDLSLDLSQSWIVGDAASDLAAGMRAGLRRGWLVATGYGEAERDQALHLRSGGFDVTVDRPLSELAELLPACRTAEQQVNL
ncbi:MAG: HAD family hydrolase [Rhodospirillaceae bacterium]|jgi:D-glycero-D-manno-heptose 1,7-bisphosphate phosphatase|nr:HAD family hydrolase [Rhodospirillaceae bacterium]MBT3928997.1 HAD family hydrolase [Rhodospirillaceae bacterium]MBT5037101.1 HAD family hydrolase [Rhodospirillaceae bacterium]MBT5779558.1 HAD family hydrolase [Rhodospirillaceae bacterium]